MITIKKAFNKEGIPGISLEWYRLRTDSDRNQTVANDTQRDIGGMSLSSWAITHAPQASEIFGVKMENKSTGGSFLNKKRLSILFAKL